MKNILAAAILITFLNIRAEAQGVVVYEAPPIAAMMQKFADNNRMKPEVEGWRIQLLATTDRQKVESEKQKFQSLYPYITVDWVHTRPYYKLRAGAYRTRLETYKILYALKKDYPSAYPTVDKLRPEELVY